MNEEFEKWWSKNGELDFGCETQARENALRLWNAATAAATERAAEIAEGKEFEEEWIFDALYNSQYYLDTFQTYANIAAAIRKGEK